jgi:hypothetical protein
MGEFPSLLVSFCFPHYTFTVASGFCGWWLIRRPFMQTAQTIIKNYRRKRVIVCVTVALLTLILTLGIRFISQRNVNQQRILDFTSHTVRALDNVLLSWKTAAACCSRWWGSPARRCIWRCETGGHFADGTLHRPDQRRYPVLFEYFRQPQRACA